MSFLQINNLEKSFGATKILKGVSLEIEEGGFLVLVGPSGCGKSTLLNTIAGLEPITAGEIKIAGRNVAGLHPSKRDIAMVFQSYALYPNMTVAGNIAFGMEIRGVPKPEREAAIAKVADMLQIGHLLDRKPSQLSGGQRQRVAMGRALVRDPQVFLFDEPLSNLDAKLRIDMRTEIKRLHQRMKTTIVYVTHDQIEAMTLATKIAVLKDGILQQFGTPAEIYNNPVNMFVADFMGSPAMNLVPATIGANGNALTANFERDGRPPVSLALTKPPAGLSAFQGKKVVFGVRPEALTDPDGADRNASSIATADLHIEVVEPAGSDTFAVTNLGGKGVVARLRADANVQPGTVTPLTFNLTKTVFFDPATEARIDQPMGSPDIVIIGSGMGGATMAAGLAGSGAKVTILEKGERLLDSPETRDARAIFQRGHFRPKEMWLDAEGKPFNPGNYHVVGGNTKFYGAVLFRYRKEDFAELEFPGGGVSPAWPFPYEELEPWYSKAEQLYQVRGTTNEDPTEPFHSKDYPFKPVPDEPAIAKVRERLKSVGLHPASLPLGVDIDRWLARAQTPFDAYPDTLTGKMDAESCGLASALKDPDIDLQTGADVVRLETDEKNRIASIVYRQKGEEKRLSPRLVILSAGAIRSATLLLSSADGRNPDGLANSSDQVGHNFMNHNATFMLAVDPRTINDSVYQKTIHFNDFYFDDGKGSGPLGQVQLLGRVTGQILKSRLRAVPEFALNMLSRRSVDWYLVSEDLPRKESRVRLDGSQVILEWHFSNMKAHETLVTRVKERMRAAGYPILPSQLVDGRLPSHQCGTTRIGDDPSGYVCDPWCRSFDHQNLFIVDAGFLPTSAAVNPSLSVAAQALRVADYIRRTELV